MDQIKSQLMNRTQQVTAESYLSYKITVAYGVPQGFILGPLLFCIYEHQYHSVEFDNSLGGCRLIQYAEDTPLICSANNGGNLSALAQDKVNNKHFEGINLKTSCEQSVFMSFRFSDLRHRSISIDNNTTDKAQTFKTLALFLYQNLLGTSILFYL